ncbi:MAG: glycosyltransferase [Telluria sp.]
MKILWISPTPSHPQDAGNRAHIFAMGQHLLDAGHEITFLLYGQETVTEQGMIAMRDFWTNVVFVPHRLRDRKQSKGKIWGIDDWFNMDLELALTTLRSVSDFDVVYCEYVFFSKALTLFPASTLKVLSCHDRMSDRATMLERQGIPLDFFYTSPDQEKIGLDRADIVLAIQDDERDFFGSLTNTPVLEVGYPVENALVAPRAFYGKLRVGYLGSNNSLNRKSILQFIAIVESSPGLLDQIEIVAAGSICKALDGRPVRCMGFVADEAEFYSDIDVAINPMIDGTGLKIKTLSAIRHGIPFLSTIAGSKGLPVRMREHRATDVETQVKHVIELTRAPTTTLTALRYESHRLLIAYQERNKEQTDVLLHAIATKRCDVASRKKVLMVTDVPFWEPGMGSHARMFSLCKEVKENFDLTVFFFGSIWPARQTAIDNAGFANRIVSYKEFEANANQVIEKCNAPALPGLARWRHEVFFRSLAAYLAKNNDFNAVLVQYLWLAYTRDAVPPGILTILDTHDLMAYRDFRFTSQGLPVGVSIGLRDEVALLDRFDSVISIQHEEAAILSSVLSKAIPICCPHGVEMAMPQTSNATTAKLELGFVGGNSEANFSAIDWFLRNVWPALSNLPVTLNIFGTVCKRIGSPPAGVTLHGLIPDLSDAYAGCDAMINPMIHGGGLKIKSIESLAHGKPLIASPEGAVGIRDPGGCGVIVAKTRDEFIDAVIFLLYDRQARGRLSDDAYKAADEQFSRSKCFAPLIELIEGY